MQCLLLDPCAGLGAEPHPGSVPGGEKDPAGLLLNGPDARLVTPGELLASYAESAASLQIYTGGTELAGPTSEHLPLMFEIRGEE